MHFNKFFILFFCKKIWSPFNYFVLSGSNKFKADILFFNHLPHHSTTQLMSNGWIKSFFTTRSTQRHTSVCFVDWMVDAQVLNSTAYWAAVLPSLITLFGLVSDWSEIARLRTERREAHSQILNPLQLPLIRSETTLIKQENLDNGAWLRRDCKTDESGVFTSPGLTNLLQAREPRLSTLYCRTDLRLGRC